MYVISLAQRSKTKVYRGIVLHAPLIDSSIATVTKVCFMYLFLSPVKDEENKVKKRLV